MTISPRNEVSKMVLKIVGEIFCPNKYINLVIAASVVMSFPEITPISFNRSTGFILPHSNTSSRTLCNIDNI